MPLQTLTYKQTDRLQWEALVRDSRTGNWFQSPEAYAFYASLPKVFKPFMTAICRGESLRAVCVGYITREPGLIRQYFTRRAIIVGGPCLADDCSEEEAHALMQAVRRQLAVGHGALMNAPIYIETRNFNDYSPWREAFEKAGFVYKKHLNFHFDCSDKEQLWERLSEARRRQIRKAIQSGVTIEEAQTESEVREWYIILHRLYKRKVKTPLFPWEFFLAFFRQKTGKYLFVKYEGKVIGGIMCPVFDGRCIYEWFVCGLDLEYKDQYPSVMATWAALEYANTHALPKFDIMGAGEPDVPYGVRDFKAAFGGKLVEYGRFLYIAHPLLYRIGAAVVKWRKGKLD